MNPDMLTVFGVYDAAEEPVRVRCFVPQSDVYWSIALYAWNQHNFFVLNDRAASAGEIEIIITGRGRKHDKQGDETVVVTPTNRGIIALRAVLRDPKDSREISQLEELLNRTTISRYSEREERKPLPSTPKRKFAGAGRE